MAGDEAAEGSQSRRPMDLNMYLGLPPLPRPTGLLDAALDCPVSLPDSVGPAPVAPRTDEQVELLTPLAAYSPVNALSTPEEQLILDPFVYAWLDGHSTDGEEGTDAVDGTNSLPSPSRVASGLEAYYDLTPPRVERFVHTGPVTGGVEMVSMTSLLSPSIQGALDIEARTPELRFQRLIRISQQHSIVRTGSVNRNQRAGSPEAERLSWAIQRSHNSLEMARRQKLDGDNTVVGKGAVNKDECCGCNSSFECNICLDTAKEPVVTPCGHLFCWPCLYKWLHAHSVLSECPVCKGEVLEVNVTPIYGRGDDQGDASSLDIPPRPHGNRKESLGQQLQTADARGIATVVRQLIENQGIVRGQPTPVEAPAVPASRPRARVRSQRMQDLMSEIMLDTRNVAPENNNQVPLPPSDFDNNARRSRARIRSQRMRDLMSEIMLNRRNLTPENSNQVPLPPTDVDNTARRSRARIRTERRQYLISGRMLNTGNVVPENSNQVPLPPSNANNTMPAIPIAPEQSSSVEQTSASSTAAVIVGDPGSSRRSRPSEPPTTRRTRRRQP